MFRPIAALLLLTSTAIADGADRLPFNDGRYLTDPALCSDSNADLIKRLGDGIGAITRNINGDRLDNSYEMSCRIENVSVRGSDVTFDALCQAEGMVEKIRGHYVALSKDAFKLGARTFRRCE